MYPMLLKPILKSYIWGGERLKNDFNKLSDLKKISESWELSCHKDGLSVISNGEYSGKSLSEFFDENRKAKGTNCDGYKNFPILVKLIDANDNLSVQVHPEDNYARVKEKQSGKFEIWYIIDCQKDAEIIYGFNKKVTNNELRERINNGTLLDILNKVKVKPGDVFIIEPGTVHAIGSGILLVEVQQSSNVTYRVFDYNRKDENGNTRELHIEKALDVINTDSFELEPSQERKIEKFKGFTKLLLCNTPYFTVTLYDISESVELSADEKSFNGLIILDGSVAVNDLVCKKGDCCFIPAGLGEYIIKGKAKAIFIIPNELPLEEEEWELSHTLKNALGGELELYLKGCLIELSEKLKRPVVFSYNEAENNENQAGNEEPLKFTFIKEKYLAAQANGLCKEIWETNSDCCNNQDEKAMQVLFENKLSFWNREYISSKESNFKLQHLKYYLSKKEEEKGSEFVLDWFRYNCDTTGFVEWMIPVFVETKLVGAFITGQFKDKNNSLSVNVIYNNIKKCKHNCENCKIKELTEENISNFISKDEKVEPIYSGDKIDKEVEIFFEEINKIKKTINASYDKANKADEQRLLQRLTDFVWGKDSIYNDIPMIKPENELTSVDIINRLKAARTHLFDCVISLRDIFELEDIYLYKPISDFPTVENEIYISGGNLNENAETDGIKTALIKKANDSYTYDRDFTKSKHQLKRECLKSKISEKAQMVFDVWSDDGCKVWLKKEDGLELPANMKDYVLITFALQGYIEYPVGYLFKVRFDSKKQKKDKIEKLGRFFERITSIFLAQWAMNYSAHYKLYYKNQSDSIRQQSETIQQQSKTIHRFAIHLRHELGQSNAGYLSILSSFEKSIGKCSGNEFDRKIKNIVKNSKGFAYSTMLQANVGRYINGKIHPQKRFFYPYGTFLYKWGEVYYDNMKALDLKFNLCVLDSDNNPRMFADPDMIEQVAYNLTNNAMKYSIPGTIVNVDCCLNSNRSLYQLIVTNYAIPMCDNDIKQIFEHGFKGNNASNPQKSKIFHRNESSGIGLALSKEIAEANNGTLELNYTPISNLCVPFFELYLQMYNDFEITSECELANINDIIQKETQRLQYDDWEIWRNEINAVELINSDYYYTVYTVRDLINKGIAKYTFTLSIPNKEK